MSFKACIFDLDGTLCDSLESIACSANHALRDFGLKEAGPEEYKIFVGDGVDVLIRRLLTYCGEEASDSFEKVKERYLSYFKEGCLYHVKPYPGIVETLRELKKQGAKIAVLSNKPDENAKYVIQSVFPEEQLFDRVQGQSAAFPKKPDPAGALYIAEQFGVKPEECMYLGDTGTDMQTGTAAGMYTVGVLWGFRKKEELLEHGSDAVVQRPEEIADIYRQGEKVND